jgi:hypothetical protein
MTVHPPMREPTMMIRRFVTLSGAASDPGAVRARVNPPVFGNLMINPRSSMPSARRLARLAAVTAVFGLACGKSDHGSVAAPKVLTLLTVSVSAPSLTIQQTTTASVAGVDQDGAPISVGTVSWVSSNTGVATVSSTGATTATVTAVGAGTTTITATSNQISGQSPLAVTATAGPGGTNLTLAAAGQSAALLDSPNAVVNLTATSGSQYLVAVVNTDETPAFHEDFTIAGSLPALASVAPAAVARPADNSLATAPRFALPASAFAMAQTIRSPEVNHLELLENNRRLFGNRGNPSAAWARVAGRAGRVAPFGAAVSTTIGTVNKVYVKHSVVGSCTAVDSIGARTVAVGQHVIVLADTDLTRWPQAFRPDSSYYKTFADEYDRTTYPHILANAGDPLAFDGQLSSAGKITVTITPVLNNFTSPSGGGSIVAFVNGCDFFPFAATGDDADFSNQTEMFYSWVPASNGEDVANWERSLRGTAAHETKHLVSYTDRILHDSPDFEEIWLEEGLAQESGEIWERNFNQATFRGHATFLQTVACEINLGANAPCNIQNDKPRTLIDSHLPFFFNYLQTESTSQTEGLGLDTPSSYGAGWSIARWATDQYAGEAEGTFIKSLINEPSLTGLANLTAHTGQSSTLLLTYWNVATAIFETPNFTFADPRATTPSFNFADIFKVGQSNLTCNGVPCGLFTRSGSPTFPIQPIPLTSGTFSNSIVGVPGTSAVFYLLSATTCLTQTIRLTATTGGSLPSTSGLRMAILRVQ